MVLANNSFAKYDDYCASRPLGGNKIPNSKAQSPKGIRSEIAVGGGPVCDLGTGMPARFTLFPPRGREAQ